MSRQAPMAPALDDDAESFGIAFVDTLFSAFFIVACLFVMQSFMPHNKADADPLKAGITPGRMCVEIFWPDALDIDIDLWGRGPDNIIVGYSNRSGPMMDLLRDDLGTYQDPSGRNFETMCSRALAAGSWTFNAHYFRPHQLPEPQDVPVRMIVSFPPMDAKTPRQPEMVANGVLHKQGDEITLIDFELDKNGTVIRSSINNAPQPLRTAKVP